MKTGGKKIKKLILIIMAITLAAVSFTGCGNSNTGDSSGSSETQTEILVTGESGLTEDMERSREFWKENSIDYSDASLLIYIDLFLDDYDECLKSYTEDEIPASAFALFGYLDANFEDGTVGKDIADKGWEAIDLLYRGERYDFLAKIKEVKKAIDENSGTSETETTTTAQSAPKIEQLACEDEYASIWYTGCENSGKSYGEKYNVCFIIENKTDYQLIARVDSLSVDGWNLSDVFIYEEIAPHSKANIKIPTDELTSLDAETVTGVLTLTDESMELWGTLVRDYPFNITIE